MANQSKLKAWLRYDGTGTVVTAGPIFQANKPKVGNWRQMNADLCCNPPVPTTTTTTTRQVFTHSVFISMNASNACNLVVGGTFTVYTDAPFASGVTLYADAALTQEFPAAIYGGYINKDSTVYTVSGPVGQYLADNGTPCSSFIYSFTAYGASAPLDACQHITQQITVYANTPTLTTGVSLYMDAALTIPYNRPLYGVYLSIYFAAEDQVCTMGGPFGNIITGYVSCATLMH